MGAFDFIGMFGSSHIEEEETHVDTHEQLDHIATTRRWRNTIIDAEADTNANINTDHYPVKAKMRIKLKGIKECKVSRA